MSTTPDIAVENAIALAVKFHHGQRDKAGMPYILHPLTLMLRSSDPIVQQAAVLHDLLEDTVATRDDLVAAQLDPRAIHAIELLTHTSDLSYAEYVVRIKSDRVATQVKLLDLNDNYRLDRVAYRIEHAVHDAKRLQKYILTKQFLSDEIDQEAYLKAMPPFE
jgi:(p)ppGpp synthase/HD superfamily hydrolase